MNVTYVGGTGQQRALFQNALAHMSFPWDSLAVTVTVSWPEEPSLPGHKEYACTTTPDSVNFSLEIRRALDDPAYLKQVPPVDETGNGGTVDMQRFYVETVCHELGHVIAFHKLNVAIATVAPMFYKLVQGDGKIIGTPADLHPAGAAWPDMLQEGIAETLKDLFLPESFREFDNRTVWKLDQGQLAAFLAAVLDVTTHDGTGTPLALPYNGVPTERIIDPLIVPAFNYSDPADHLHLPPEVPVVYEPTNACLSLDPEAGVADAKIRFRWYVPADNVISGGAVLHYDAWWSTIAGLGPGPSLIGGPTEREVFPADEGLVEFPYPLGIPPVGYDCFIARCSILGIIHGPGGGAFTGWSQAAIFTGTYVPHERPPWPYTDPAISAGGGPWATVRFRTR